MTIGQQRVFDDLLNILKEVRDGWEYSGEISLNTTFFGDLGFESIDVVAFVTAVEEHYRQSFPFAEFLADFWKREAQDIRIGELAEFVHQHLNNDSG